MILKNRMEMYVLFTQVYFQLYAKYPVLMLPNILATNRSCLYECYSTWHMQRVMQLSAVNCVLNSLDSLLGIAKIFAKHTDEHSSSTEIWEFTDQRKYY